MSRQIDDGGSAFPRSETVEEMRDATGRTIGHRFYPAQPGMSLRDWLAGQEKIDSSEEIGWDLCEALAGPRPSGSYSTSPLEWFNWDNKWKAAIRYARADAMLVARKGGNQ